MPIEISDENVTELWSDSASENSSRLAGEIVMLKNRMRRTSSEERKKTITNGSIFQSEIEFNGLLLVAMLNICALDRRGRCDFYGISHYLTGISRD